MAAFLRFSNIVRNNNRSICFNSRRSFGVFNGSANRNHVARQIPAFIQQTQPVRLYSSAKLNESTVESQGDQTGGQVQKHEFQAETRMLLDIVARSLYSESEVFLRELISNASDALEKFRYTVHTAGDNEKDFEQTDRVLEILIETCKQEQQLIIQDTGIGMTREELVNNLGTIARSGSKQFLEQIKSSGGNTASSENIIGQFGVGFYSAFMVADKVDVYTRSSKVGSPGLHWSSDGSGTYEIEEVNDVDVGTKVVIHLKNECREYADEKRINGIIKKYSNFVGSPILLNHKQVNDTQPVWLLDPKEVSKQQYHEFYRYISNVHDNPRYILHYKTDVPLSIRAVLYIPETKPSIVDLSMKNTNSGVSLYTRKVLIQSKCEMLLPTWLRFVNGVVDSEDIPLNLSRELLQNSDLIRKLRTVLTNRFVRFLQERAAKEPAEYKEFYEGYSMFLKQGIITVEEPGEREEIAKLLRFDTSRLPAGSNKISLAEYINKIPAEQNEIFYLAAPNRQLAESSPYYESLKSKNIEVLFCYDGYDELVLMQLARFMNKAFVSVEKQMRKEQNVDEEIDFGSDSLQHSEVDEMISYLKTVLAGRVFNVKATAKLVEHPCALTLEDMAAARHFIRTRGQSLTDEIRYSLLQPQLEINPKHPIIKKLHSLTDSDPELSHLLALQLFENAAVAAGLCQDAQSVLRSMNKLLSKVLERY